MRSRPGLDSTLRKTCTRRLDRAIPVGLQYFAQANAYLVVQGGQAAQGCGSFGQVSVERSTRPRSRGQYTELRYTYRKTAPLYQSVSALSAVALSLRAPLLSERAHPLLPARHADPVRAARRPDHGAPPGARPR